MSGSTLPARALGRLLAQHRERAGMTKYAAGQLVDTSQQTVARIEYGQKSKVSLLWVNVWSDAYRVSDDERRLMCGLARELSTAQKNWWRAYVDELKPHFDYYLGLEESARALSVWRTNLLPGLLQTAKPIGARLRGPNPRICRQIKSRSACRWLSGVKPVWRTGISPSMSSCRRQSCWKRSVGAP